MEGIPDEQSISAAAEFKLLDASGKEVRFGDLFKEKKTIVVFIRKNFCLHHLVTKHDNSIFVKQTGHFFCGVRLWLYQIYL